MTMFVFVYKLIFWIYFPHMREHIHPWSFWAWLTSLNMMSSDCIHLPSNYMVSFFLMAEWNSIVYIHIFEKWIKSKEINFSIIVWNTCIWEMDHTYEVFLGGEVLGFEHWDICLFSRCSTTWAILPTLFVLEM
jgi:hypothetical protein